MIDVRKKGATGAVDDEVMCTECGEVLLEERIELGYDYCTKPECQKRRHRGLKVTTVGVHKSADTLIVADDGEIARRGESGELTSRDTGIAIDYRGPGSATPSARPAVPAPRPTPAPARRPGWSRTQEDVVRLYHDMGLRPDQIVERARQNNPRLGITRSLVLAILATPPARRP